MTDTGKCGLTCGNAFAEALDVVGNRRAGLKFLRTICGLLALREAVGSR